MSFSDNKKNVDKYEIDKQKGLKEYEELSLIYDERKRLNEIKEKALPYLFDDLIETECQFQFNKSLSQDEYFSANQHALSCLEISLKAKKIFPRKLPNWLKESLKCFDQLLLKYINDVLNEIIIHKTGEIYERAIYNHLSKKGNSYKIIGDNFKNIYKIRSNFEHRLYVDPKDNKTKYRRLSATELKNGLSQVLEYFKLALTHLLSYFKKAYSHLVLNQI